MQTNPSNPYHFFVFILPIRFISCIISGIHILAVRWKWLPIPSCLRETPGGLYNTLRKIWSARLLKKLVSVWVRSPFRSQILQLVNVDFTIPSGKGLILVTCHTPWKRLLVNWFFENHYALIIDTGKSRLRKARLKNQRKGHNELQHIIRHLQYGGQVVIAADVFNKNNNQPTEILGKSGNLSLLPVRLARIAGVPLMAAVPRLRNGVIHIDAGPLYDQVIRPAEMGSVMQNMLRFFEHEIKMDPSIWSYFVNEPLSQFHKKRIE